MNRQQPTQARVTKAKSKTLAGSHAATIKGEGRGPATTAGIKTGSDKIKTISSSGQKSKPSDNSTNSKVKYAPSPSTVPPKYPKPSNKPNTTLSTEQSRALQRKAEKSPLKTSSYSSSQRTVTKSYRPPVNDSKTQVSAKSKPAQEDKYEYEDDFEEYESDFEEDISEKEQSISNDGQEVDTTEKQEANDEEEDASESQPENSLSVQEYEYLEKMVEVEFKEPLRNSPQHERNRLQSLQIRSEISVGESSLNGSEKGNIESVVVGDGERNVENMDTKDSSKHTKSEFTFYGGETRVNGSEIIAVQDAISTEIYEDESKVKVERGLGERRSSLLSFPMFSNDDVAAIPNPAVATPSSLLREGSSSKSRMMFDFNNGQLEAQKKAKLERGKKLQSMIKLDKTEVDIFHMNTFRYEDYMASFASSKSSQMSTQTEDDKLEESAQTEEIILVNKWTQKPPSWSTMNYTGDVRLARQEALGVGLDAEDLTEVDRSIEKQFDFLKNFEEYSDFVIRSSQLILTILESGKRMKLPTTGPGSATKIKLSRGLSILNKLQMHTLTCEGEFVACSNGKASNEQTRKHGTKNMVTIWSLKEPSMPLHFLRIWGLVTSLKIHPLFHLAVSGNMDGSLNFWNLKEPSYYHTQYQDQTIRSPSVNTSCMEPFTHSITIAALEVIPETKSTLQILSIDKENILISWSCTRSNNVAEGLQMSPHNSAWSTLHVTARTRINLQEMIASPDTEPMCFIAWQEELTRFLVGTNYGFVTNGSITEEVNSAKVKKFKLSEKDDFVVKIRCLDLSRPLNIFAAGYEDSKFRLFCLSKKKFILSMDCGDIPWKMKWSGRRASVLYIAMKDRLDIWDLLVSDLTPWKTIPVKDFQEFALFTSPQKEFMVTISANDLAVSSFQDEIDSLDAKDEVRLQQYLTMV